MRSKIEQVPSPDFFLEVPTSGICLILLTNTQKSDENNTSLAKAIKSTKAVFGNNPLHLHHLRGDCEEWMHGTACFPTCIS